MANDTLIGKTAINEYRLALLPEKPKTTVCDVIPITRVRPGSMRVSTVSDLKVAGKLIGKTFYKRESGNKDTRKLPTIAERLTKPGRKMFQ